MTEIHIKKRNGGSIVFTAQDHLSLMENLQTAAPGEVLALCGGCMSCATCHIYVDEQDLARLTPMSDEEDMLLDDAPSRGPRSRLSCQIKVTPELSGLRVEIAPEH